MEKILTIFTPTYNRAYSLPQLYNSIIQQNNKDFIWLIVDDGSTDNTKELITSWQEEGLVDIVYLLQPNGGKMRAHNHGVKYCRTPLFFCIDSDDYLTPYAVETIISSYEKIEGLNDICGILAKRKIINRKSSTNMPVHEYMTLHELYSSGFYGDTSIIFKTEIIKKFLFPEIEGEKFITEAFVYDQLDQRYKYFIVDKDLMVCEYQDDGYTANAMKLKQNNPKGWALYYSQYYSLYAHSIRDKVKYMGYYIAFMIKAHYCIQDILRKSPSFLFCLISFIIGVYFYKRDLIV